MLTARTEINRASEQLFTTRADVLGNRSCHGQQRHGQELPTAGEFGLAGAIGQEAVMPDTLKARRQHVQQLCGELNYVARRPQVSILPQP